MHEETKRKKTGTIRLVLAGMLAAAVAITTAYLKIPLAFGYIHLGDALIFLSAAVLGPFAAVPAGIGSMLADLLAGYVVYMPATFVIKFLVGLTAGFVLKRNQSSISRPAEKKPSAGKLAFYALIFLLCELFMAAGYFFYEWFLYSFTAAVSGLPFNLIQGASGVIIGMALLPLAQKLRVTAERI